jgi:hypothetical protein
MGKLHPLTELVICRKEKNDEFACGNLSGSTFATAGKLCHQL